MNIPDDKQLVASLRKDNQEAFKHLFNLYHKRVYAFAHNILPSAADAEEIVQNVFLSLWNQRKNLLISGSLSSYIFGIARHFIYRQIQNKLRHEAFTEFFLEQNKDFEFITEEQVLFKELSDIMSDAIKKLPERRREIFILSRMEGLSYKEIAQKLEITENTVDTQIRHALDFLRIQISGYQSD